MNVDLNLNKVIALILLFQKANAIKVAVDQIFRSIHFLLILMLGIPKGQPKYLYLRAKDQVYGIATAIVLASVSKYLKKHYELIAFHDPYYVAK